MSDTRKPLWVVSAPDQFRRVVRAKSADEALRVAMAEEFPGVKAEPFPDRGHHEMVAGARRYFQDRYGV